MLSIFRVHSHFLLSKVDAVSVAESRLVEESIIDSPQTVAPPVTQAETAAAGALF